MTDKPDCYQCKYRGEVPGSCHSSCNHPAFAKINDDPLLQLMGMLGKRGPLSGLVTKTDGCVVTGNAHGIRNGWFVHPFNFDPVWLESCTGFERASHKDNAL